MEGVVADRNITLGHLLGTIKQFFHRLGISQVRFKPAYNPYTEPSMEVFAYHPGLKKWVEVRQSIVVIFFLKRKRKFHISSNEDQFSIQFCTLFLFT